MHMRSGNSLKKPLRIFQFQMHHVSFHPISLIASSSFNIMLPGCVIWQSDFSHHEFQQFTFFSAQKSIAISVHSSIMIAAESHVHDPITILVYCLHVCIPFSMPLQAQKSFFEFSLITYHE